jgi:hypothetical protein
MSPPAEPLVPSQEGSCFMKQIFSFCLLSPPVMKPKDIFKKVYCVEIIIMFSCDDDDDAWPTIFNTF